MDLRTEATRQAIVTALMNLSAEQNLSALEKNEVACRLADLLGIDYAGLVKKRILQLMGAQEIGELSRDGVDFQLHTHRHRMPKDESLFQKEMEDNRACLRGMPKRKPYTFCYPSGFYSHQFTMTTSSIC